MTKKDKALLIQKLDALPQDFFNECPYSDAEMASCLSAALKSMRQRVIEIIESIPEKKYEYQLFDASKLDKEQISIVLGHLSEEGWKYIGSHEKYMVFYRGVLPNEN